MKNSDLLVPYFMNSNESERELKVEKIIRSHVIWASAAGLIPVPMLDVVSVTAIQKDMVKKLAELYGEDFSESEARAWVSSLAASAGARMAADAVKFIPGMGSVVGGITMSLLSGATTYAIGKVFKKHFASGGTFLDFKPENFKEYFNSEFQKGKNKIKDWIKDKKINNEDLKLQDLSRKLKNIEELYRSGALTEEEFQIWKEKLISNI